MSALVFLGISAISLGLVIGLLRIRFRPAKALPPARKPSRQTQTETVGITRFSYSLTDYKPELIPATAAGSTPPELAALQVAKEEAAAVAPPSPEQAATNPAAPAPVAPAETNSAAPAPASGTSTEMPDTNSNEIHKDNPISEPAETETDMHNRKVEEKLTAQRARDKRRAAFITSTQRMNNPKVTTPTLA